MDWKHLSSRLLNGTAYTRLPLLASGVAVALLASSAARVTWLVVPPPAQTMAPLVSEASNMSGTAPRPDPMLLSQEIARRHLLGSSQAALPATNQPMPETQLSLVLRGVAASPNPKAAFAIIAEPAGKENYYRVGDPLPGGATLKEVHPQHIVLARGDRFETLRLPQQALTLDGAASQSTSTAAPAPVAVAPDAGVALQQVRDQFVQDPQTLANLLQGEPFRQDGRVVGFRVRPGRDAALFAKFGLQSGDVVTAVNGVSVTDAQGRLDLMRSISGADEVTVDLLRGGSPLSVTIPIAQ